MVSREILSTFKEKNDEKEPEKENVFVMTQSNKPAAEEAAVEEDPAQPAPEEVGSQQENS